MGFERMTAVMQGKQVVFETDLFEPLVKEVRKVAPGTKVLAGGLAFRLDPELVPLAGADACVIDAIALQHSAYPYHDWNERITAECYAPNSVARIVDGDNRIIKLINNYARISFNFGPTLLSWLEAKAPEVYAAILEADRESQQRFSGHGSALAGVR